MSASYRLRQKVWHRHHAGLRAVADKLARLYADAGETTSFTDVVRLHYTNTNAYARARINACMHNYIRTHYTGKQTHCIDLIKLMLSQLVLIKST